MNISTTLMSTAALALLISACDGPKERAGAAKDEAAARAAGVAYDGKGPAERAGAAADRVDQAAAKARDSQADAFENQGRVIRAKAEADADRLEQQAEALREHAKNKAKALDERAKAIRSQ
jgi:hypothetical protein